jgi:DNA-binding transcriptional MerR regulator
MAHSTSATGTETDRKRQETYTIGQLAREFDVTTRAIRFYESQGLLNPQREGQRRIYSRRDRTRLKLTLRGRRIGMTLAEIQEVFDLYDSSANGETRQLERFLRIVEEKRAELQRRRQDIDDALAELEETARRCRAFLAEKNGQSPGEAAE